MDLKQVIKMATTRDQLVVSQEAAQREDQSHQDMHRRLEVLVAVQQLVEL